MSLNSRFNEWVDHLSGQERIILLLAYMIGVMFCPLLAAIIMAYPDGEKLASYGRYLTLFEAVLFLIPLTSRWIWLNRHPLS